MKKINILEYLSGLSRDKPVFFFPNPGNAGDALINSSACDIFCESGLRWAIVNNPEEFLKGRVVIFSGGGGLVSSYDRVAETLKKTIQFKPKKLNQCPCTR